MNDEYYRLKKSMIRTIQEKCLKLERDEVDDDLIQNPKNSLKNGKKLYRSKKKTSNLRESKLKIRINWFRKISATIDSNKRKYRELSTESISTKNLSVRTQLFQVLKVRKSTRNRRSIKRLRFSGHSLHSTFWTSMRYSRIHEEE